MFAQNHSDHSDQGPGETPTSLPPAQHVNETSTDKNTENLSKNPDIKPLSTTSRSWRFALAALGFVILCFGQIFNTNDWFPLGSLSQYSYGRPLDSPTRSVRIIAVNTEGNDIRVPLNAKGVGVGRAEVEGQLDAIIADPSKLEGLARAWHGLHPESPQFTHLTMERVTSYVKDGKPTGQSDVEFLAEWTVQGNYGETQ
ncbi:hypothetical protein [Timonella sp. A28]|uniref:hypothetical protein n=1 Tax=Timonella sp. A28 TaxID=3442640 RepID=UPI003EBE2CEC